jgi:hypothetical protein
MATTKQKEAARRNIAKARQVQSERAQGAEIKRSSGLSTAEKDRLPDKDFAFPKERKEPLTDARHVRNAIARFDQVEGVTDKERDEAWRRIVRAAKRFDVEVQEKSWRDLFKGGKANKKG